MDTTSFSLLERLRRPAEPAAWGRFVQLYTPLLYRWARRLGLAEEDAADLVQDVFVLLVRTLPDFQYDRDRRFRGWLWTVTLNAWRTRLRRPPAGRQAGDSILDAIAVADPAEVRDEAEYRQYLIGRALRIVQRDFEPATWQAFCALLEPESRAEDVAARLGLSVGAVYAARSRVLRRLRAELQGLLD